MSSFAAALWQMLWIYWPLLLGNLLEWYEFGVYGYLAAPLKRQFFQGSEIGVWLGFALTFLARPLGGTVLGVIGDRWERSAAINCSMVGMLVGTCGQGLLPTSAAGRSWLGLCGLGGLVLLRVVQGLSAAGEIPTIATYLAEVLDQRFMCRGLSTIFITANIGFFLAKSTVYLTTEVFGEEALMQWAWRLPFLFALAPGLIALWGRRGLPESTMFLEARQRSTGQEPARGQGESKDQRAKVLSTFAAQWKAILLGAAAVASSATVCYGVFVWGQSFLQTSGMPATHRFLVDGLSRAVVVLLCLPVGWLADRHGVGCMTLVGGAALLLGAFPLWLCVERAPTSVQSVALALGLGFGVIGSLVGPLNYVFLVELFPTEVRNTATGLSLNIGYAIFGGVACVVAEAALEWSRMGPALIFALSGAVTVLAVVAGLLLHRRGTITVAHVRQEPYFLVCGVELGRPRDLASMGCGGAKCEACPDNAGQGFDHIADVP